MIDSTSLYSILKHFKLQQFNIISFLSKVTPMSSIYIDYLKYRYKSSKLYHVSNRLRFDTFFTFIHSFENGHHLLHKNSQMTIGIIQLQNEQFTNKTLDKRECSKECSQKVFLKISQISLENTCAE